MSDIPVPTFPTFLADPAPLAAHQPPIMPLPHILIMALIAAAYFIQFLFAYWGKNYKDSKIESVEGWVTTWFFFLTLSIPIELGRWVDADANLPGGSTQTTYQQFISIYSSILTTFIIVEFTIVASLVSLMFTRNANQDWRSIFYWSFTVLCSALLDIGALVFIIVWKLDKDFNVNPFVNPRSLMYWILLMTSLFATGVAIMYSQSFLQKHHMGLQHGGPEFGERS